MVSGVRRCKYSKCRKPYEAKFSTLEECCSPSCAIGYAKELSTERLARKWRRAVGKERTIRRRELREHRKKSMSLSKLKNLADREFGRFIRERDFGQPCICCGEYAKSGERENGGVYDAGHYRTKGAADHLRYNEDNAHLQRKYCNRWRSGNQAAYRVRLIDKIGLAKVEALDNDNGTHKWTRDELTEIRRKYLAKWKALKKLREENPGWTWTSNPAAVALGYVSGQPVYDPRQ